MSGELGMTILGNPATAAVVQIAVLAVLAWTLHVLIGYAKDSRARPTLISSGSRRGSLEESSPSLRVVTPAPIRFPRRPAPQDA